MNTKTKKIQVTQKPEDEVPVEIIAKSIRNIGEAVKRLNQSGLSDKAIILLLTHGSGESQTTVRNVLWALRNLEGMYLKK